jgi:hypothetical protein
MEAMEMAGQDGLALSWCPWAQSSNAQDLCKKSSERRLGILIKEAGTLISQSDIHMEVA